MKVSIITRHGVGNYGSLLQSMATQNILNILGFESEIINYRRNDEDYLNLTKTQLASKPEWNKNYIKRFIYRLLREPESILAGKSFDKWRNKYLKLTQKYTEYEQLQKMPPQADIYMTGSDQVWGAIGSDDYDKAYFLDFVSEDKKRIAYAASFGKTNFTEDIINSYSEWLSRYDSISVREKSAVEIIKNMGLGEVSQVLDPTLLITSDEWSEYIDSEIRGKYVLVYQLHKNKLLDRYAIEFAKKADLPLLRISPSIHQINRGGKFVYLPDVGKFLSYIKNAEYMITDSFHGTAFAINFNTQFVDILPGKTKTRNQSILELTGLTDRILTNADDFGFIDKKIDFTRVNTILKKERENSINILKGMLECE